MSRLQAVPRIASALIAMFAVCAAAQAAPFAIDTSIGAGADAYVRGGSNAGNTYGTAAEIVLKYNTNVSYRRKGYARFDVGALSPKVVADATLTLDVALNNAGGGSTTPQTFQVDVFGLTAGHTGEGWDETTIYPLFSPMSLIAEGSAN